LVVLALAALGGCTSVEPQGAPTVPLINSAGQPIGSVGIWEAHHSVFLRVRATGLMPGEHGIHVHAVGRCDPPNFESAGPHWNPWNMQHGMNNLAGPHAGDLPNAGVRPDGLLDETMSLTATTIAQLLDADGSSIVIHADRDDYETDPSGNS